MQHYKTQTLEKYHQITHTHTHTSNTLYHVHFLFIHTNIYAHTSIHTFGDMKNFFYITLILLICMLVVDYF